MVSFTPSRHQERLEGQPDNVLNVPFVQSLTAWVGFSVSMRRFGCMPTGQLRLKGAGNAKQETQLRGFSL
jgi:hypothetical protein